LISEEKKHQEMQMMDEDCSTKRVSIGQFLYVCPKYNGISYKGICGVFAKIEGEET
jgi:hypothetical protein